jgi:hypothetical protein
MKVDGPKAQKLHPYPVLCDAFWYAGHGLDGIAPMAQAPMPVLVLRVVESLAGTVPCFEIFRLSEALLGLLQNAASVLQRLHWCCFENVFEVDLRSNSLPQNGFRLECSNPTGRVRRRTRCLFWNIKFIKRQECGILRLNEFDWNGLVAKKLEVYCCKVEE